MSSIVLVDGNSTSNSNNKHVVSPGSMNSSTTGAGSPPSGGGSSECPFTIRTSSTSDLVKNNPLPRRPSSPQNQQQNGRGGGPSEDGDPTGVSRSGSIGHFGDLETGNGSSTGTNILPISTATISCASSGSNFGSGGSLTSTGQHSKSTSHKLPIGSPSRALLAAAKQKVDNASSPAVQAFKSCFRKAPPLVSSNYETVSFTHECTTTNGTVIRQYAQRCTDREDNDYSSSVQVGPLIFRSWSDQGKDYSSSGSLIQLEGVADPLWKADGHGAGASGPGAVKQGGDLGLCADPGMVVDPPTFSDSSTPSATTQSSSPTCEDAPPATAPEQNFSEIEEVRSAVEEVATVEGLTVDELCKVLSVFIDIPEHAHLSK